MMIMFFPDPLVGFVFNNDLEYLSCSPIIWRRFTFAEIMDMRDGFVPDSAPQRAKDLARHGSRFFIIWIREEG